MKRAISVCLTLALHGAVVALALGSCTIPGSKKYEKPVRPPVEDETVMHLSATSTTGSMLCRGYSYDGIGLGHTNEGVVWLLADGGPAYRAGIREGDRVRGKELDALHPGKFPVGTVVRIYKLVGTRWVPISMKIETICSD